MHLHDRAGTLASKLYDSVASLQTLGPNVINNQPEIETLALKVLRSKIYILYGSKFL